MARIVESELHLEDPSGSLFLPKYPQRAADWLALESAILMGRGFAAGATLEEQAELLGWLDELPHKPASKCCRVGTLALRATMV